MEESLENYVFWGLIVYNIVGAQDPKIYGGMLKQQPGIGIGPHR